jgi:hypothetical protein
MFIHPAHFIFYRVDLSTAAAAMLVIIITKGRKKQSLTVKCIIHVPLVKKV